MEQNKKAIHIQGRCPVCHSKDLTHDQPIFNAYFMRVNFQCLTCGNYGQQSYLIKYEGSTVFNQDNTETFVNVGDETIGETL